jgi:hypothetical protein
VTIVSESLFSYSITQLHNKQRCPLTIQLHQHVKINSLRKNPAAEFSVFYYIISKQIIGKFPQFPSIKIVSSFEFDQLVTTANHFAIERIKPPVN